MSESTHARADDFWATSRFTWRAQSNVLVESGDSICLPVVDVYIAIINATGSKPFSGHIDKNYSLPKPIEYEKSPAMVSRTGGQVCARQMAER
jgi:hypothetical protein